MRRSRNAVTAGVSPKSVGQSSSGRFEVMIVEARSYRRITISSKSSAALAGSFRIPRSSIISSGTSLRAVMTSLRSPEASARTRSDERSVLPRHTSPCTRGARQGLDRLRPRCGLCPIRLRRSRHARERCCGSAAPIASLSCLPARSPRPGGRWALHRGGVRFRQRARHQKTRLVTETPDRFVSVAGFAGNAPDAPAQTQQAKDRFPFGCAQLVHGGAFAPPPKANPRSSRRRQSPPHCAKCAVLKCPPTPVRFSSARRCAVLSAPRGFGLHLQRKAAWSALRFSATART